MSSVKAGSASNDVKAIFFNGHQYVLTMSKASLMMGRPFSSKARFVNYDGTLLQEQTIEYGHQVTAYTGSTPTKPQSSDATMQYSFSGWNPTLPQTITQQTDIMAQYTTLYRQRFLNYDGTVLQTSYVASGGTIQYTGTTPTKPDASDASIKYTFNTWSPTVSSVSYSRDYTATYTPMYRIKFINYDGTILQDSYLTMGSTVTYTGNAPTKASDSSYNYTFSGWSPTISTVSGATTYTATYNQTPIAATYAEMQTYINSMAAPTLTKSGTSMVMTFTPFTGKYLQYITDHQLALPSGIRQQVYVQVCHYGSRGNIGELEKPHRGIGSTTARRNSSLVCQGTIHSGEPLTVRYIPVRGQNTQGNVLLTASAASAGSVTISDARTSFKVSHYKFSAGHIRMGLAIALNSVGHQAGGAVKECSSYVEY